MLYNDLSRLGGKQEKVGNKLVTTIREKYRGVDLVNIPAEVEKKLDIIQNGQGWILYESAKTIIQCNPEDRLEDIVQKLTVKLEKNTKDLFFILDGQLLDIKKTFK